MPSNEKLIENINKVATEKGVEVPNTVGLNNGQLNETLKSLRALETKPAESTEENENLTPGSDDSGDESTTTDPDAEKAAADRAEIVKANKEKAEKEKRDKEKAEAKAKRDAIPPYRVADGKSITCKKGILADGDEVKAEYLPGGQETLDSLVDRDFVIKK